MKPAIRRRLRALAAHADTGPGFERLVEYVETLTEPALWVIRQPDGTQFMQSAPRWVPVGTTAIPPVPEPLSWWGRMARLLREGH